jgi:hypothetical protein
MPHWKLLTDGIDQLTNGAVAPGHFQARPLFIRYTGRASIQFRTKVVLQPESDEGARFRGGCHVQSVDRSLDLVKIKWT